ncbi:MAG: hypothetical protein AAGJ82_07780 [Bacteroidota bacterium]
MNKYTITITLFALAIFQFTACEDDDIPLPQSCEWEITQEPSVIDSCFERPRLFTGTIIEGDLVNDRRIRYFNNDLSSEDLLYFITKLESNGPAELYRLDLCKGEVTLLETLSTMSGSNLRMNASRKLVYPRFLQNVDLFDSNTLESTNILSDIYVTDVAWVNDTSFICRQDVPAGNDFELRWIMYNLEGTLLDTLPAEFVKASNQNGSQIAFSTDNYDGEQDDRVIIYDFAQQATVAEHTFPSLSEFRSGFLLHWLDATRLLVYTGKLIALYDLPTDELTILLDHRECDNVVYGEVAAQLSDPNKFFYLLKENFYDENDELKVSYDIIQYDLETQEEVKLVF